MKNHLNENNLTRAYLRKKALPSGDYSYTNGPVKEFSAGGHYAIELSSMNNPSVLNQTLVLAKKYHVNISRAIECRGIMRLPDQDIKDMVDMCAANSMGLVLSIGPRATNDIGGFVKSESGHRVGYRLRGMENMIYAIEDVKRAMELGVRGFLIYDEGMLWLLNQMRLDGELPNNIMFKYSVHAGCANPLSARLLADNGADCINLVPDLDMNMLSAFRQAVSVPIDVFTDTAKAAGGFIRTYQIPEMIRLAAPLYLKCGPVSQPQQNHLPSSNELEERVKQTRNVVEHISRYLPDAKVVSPNERSLGLPNTKLTFNKPIPKLRVANSDINY